MKQADAVAAILSAAPDAKRLPSNKGASVIHQIAPGIQAVALPDVCPGWWGIPGSAYVTLAASPSDVPALIVSSACPTGIAVTPEQLASLLNEAVSDF